MGADASLVQVRLQVLVVEVEADVAVEVAVDVVAGVAFDRAPDLLGRFGVARQHGHAAAGTLDRGVDAVLRPRLREHDAVRVGEEVADAGVTEYLIYAWRVAALRQPDPFGPLAEMTLELAAADLHLRAHRVLVDRHQRQEAVR